MLYIHYMREWSICYAMHTQKKYETNIQTIHHIKGNGIGRSMRFEKYIKS